MARVNLKRLLKERGITKYQFAKALGLRPPSVRSFFKPNCNPKLNTLAEWAIVLDCPIAKLIDEKSNRPKGIKKAKRTL